MEARKENKFFLTVMKVKREDTAAIRFIIENVMENADLQSATEYLEKLLSDDRTYLLAILSDNEVIGYALAYRFPSLYAYTYMAYLYDIEVAASHRRKGAGRLLITTMITYLQSDGVTELWLGSATGNKEGQALFSSTGAIRSDETFNDFTYYLK